MRRIGINVIAILILSFIAAVIVARGFHLGVPAAVLSFIVGGGSLATLYVTWEGLRPPREGADKADSLKRDTDRLAAAVQGQWEEEFDARVFNDPSQHLTVSWTAADESLMADWGNLLHEAAHGPGRSDARRLADWGAGRESLTGFEDELPAVLRKVPTGWLVVLGGPGYGKSMLMLRLVLDLHGQREEGEGDPVPVFISMASWNPAEDSLHSWLAEQLPIDYPALDDMVSDGDGENSRLAALLAARKIIPILDGLDEMPSGSQAMAIRKLNLAFTGPRRPPQLVVTCRTDDYKKAIAEVGGRLAPLAGAAAIELHALDPDKVADYLAQRTKDKRWAAVVEALNDPESPVAKALRIPLYASLASAIYNPKEHDPHGVVQDPGKLANRDLFPDQEAIEKHLLDTFVPAMFAADQRIPEEAPDEDAAEEEKQRNSPAERWLMFLAYYLTYGREKTTSLQWWDLTGRVIAPRWLVPAVVGTVCAIAVGLAAGTGTNVGVGIGLGFGAGMLLAIAIGLVTRAARHRLDRKGYRKRYGKGRPGPGMAGGLIGAVIGGLGAGIAHRYGIGREASLFSGLPEALGIGIGAGASTEFAGGLVGSLFGSFVAGYLAAVGVGPSAGVVNGLGVGLAAGLAVELVGRRKPARRLPRRDHQVGLIGGIVIGSAIGFIAWRKEGVIAGIVAGVALAAAAEVPFSFSHTEQNLDYVPSPGLALSRDVTAFRLTALSAGPAAAIAGFVGGSMTSIYEVQAKPSVSVVVTDGLGIGLASGLVIGLTFGFYHAASARFRIISWWLALRGKTPWQLQDFLKDAYKRSVLRQVGASYEFRHAILQQRLADHWKAGHPRRPRRRDQSAGEIGEQAPVPGSPASASASPAQPLTEAP